MEKQTAVAWFRKELIKRFKRSEMHYTNSEWCFDMINKLSEQAEAMQKMQITESWDDGFSTGFAYGKDGSENGVDEGEQYFNKTFKKE